jgi:hypothetical protein
VSNYDRVMNQIRDERLAARASAVDDWLEYVAM